MCTHSKRAILQCVGFRVRYDAMRMHAHAEGGNGLTCLCTHLSHMHKEHMPLHVPIRHTYTHISIYERERERKNKRKKDRKKEIKKDRQT